MAGSVYFLRQELSLAAQKMPEKPGVAEKFKRAGLVLVDSSVADNAWKRILEHFVLLDTDLPAISGKPAVNRAALRALHKKAVTQNKIPVYLKDAIEIQSTLLNTTPGIVVDIDMVPYTLPRHILPVPFEAAYLPTVTPNFPPPAPPAPPGKSEEEPWKGILPLAFGPVPFDIPFTCKRIEKNNVNVTIQLTWDPVTLSAHAERATWSLKTEGGYNITLDPTTRAWFSAQGSTAFILSLKRDTEPGASPDAPMFEGFRMENHFNLARIPASFNDDAVLTSLWVAPNA